MSAHDFILMIMVAFIGAKVFSLIPTKNKKGVVTITKGIDGKFTYTLVINGDVVWVISSDERIDINNHKILDANGSTVDVKVCE